MSVIPPDVIDRMMVKCARRCCICRRFRPTKLQVHHIVERSQGGSNDEENLIVVCFSCHSDVHTKVPFARRFSADELKGHRDALVAAVVEGKLPEADSDDADEVVARLIHEMRSVTNPRLSLLPEAVEILLKAVGAEGYAQGNIHAIKYDGGFAIMVGNGITLGDSDDRRLQTRYKHGLKQLLESALLDHVSNELYEVNYDGYLAADEIASTGPSFISEEDE